MFRTVVLPVLRLLVWAVIAVALVALAFRGGGSEYEESAGPGAPTIDLSEPTVPVERGTVTNTVKVDGTVVADAGIALKATAAGTVRRILVAAGAGVTAGQPVLEIRYEEEREPLAGKDAEGNPTSTPQSPRVRTATVSAPAAGTLTTVDVLVDQIVAVGDAVGTISPGTLSVTAPLTQAEQFRLLAPPSTAEVTVQGGPAPFTCNGLTLGAPPAGSAPQNPDPAGDPAMGPPMGPGGEGSGSGTTARCAVPAGVTVFAGMTAKVEVQAGRAENVPVVPVTAVQGAVQTGKVWVPGGGGKPEERPVVLGLSDGERVEIREGVAEGDLVLQFVPVPDDTPVRGEEGYVMGGPVG